MRRFFGALMLSAVLITPAAMRADDHDKRYYDSAHKDYHEWNAHEQDTYRKWREDQHLQYRDWDKANKKEQRDYFKWRHDHPDDRH